MLSERVKRDRIKRPSDVFTTESLLLPLPDLFDNYMQQDAHEFLNYLLNTVADILQEEKKQEKQNGRLKNNGTAGATEAETDNKTESTWVHDIFQGTLTNETRCLNCETVRCPTPRTEGVCFNVPVSPRLTEPLNGLKNRLDSCRDAEGRF